MKPKPVRVCDVSRVLRISSASLITFLEDRGFSVKGDFRSPLSGRMVELIQNGYQEGPPFQELNPLIPRAEEWEKLNTSLVEQLHTPPARPSPTPMEEFREPKRRKPRKPKLQLRSASNPPIYTGRIELSFLDLELIQRTLELAAPEKTRVRDFLRRKTILKAIAKLE